MSYMKQNKKQKQTLESAHYGLEISFKLCYTIRVGHVIRGRCGTLPFFNLFASLVYSKLKSTTRSTSKILTF